MRESAFDPLAWESRFAAFSAEQMGGGDAAHDQSHLLRVVANAKALAAAETAELAIVLPAAWLHDCVSIPKDSSQRNQASRQAAKRAGEWLRGSGYLAPLIPAIEHAIAAHSFSAGIPPQTLEAKVVQDADRLDALGAIGIARTLMLGGANGTRLYDPTEPFPFLRAADDGTSVIDHFFTKLLSLEGTMHTAAGRTEAQQRARLIKQFLTQLGHEIGVPIAEESITDRRVLSSSGNSCLPATVSRSGKV